ncbi:MAG: InlB B-repeat-containing protein, partial [Bacillota bacterium]
MRKVYRTIILLIMMALICSLFLACEQNSYELTFEPNGGEQIDSVQNNGEDIINLPEPQRQGYTFEGWFLDNDTFENEYTGAPLTESITVYAKWSVNEVVDGLILTYDNYTNSYA